MWGGTEGVGGGMEELGQATSSGMLKGPYEAGKGWRSQPKLGPAVLEGEGCLLWPP